MADYAAAVERAQSRAAVLQSLQASYGSGKANTTSSKPSATNNSSKNTSSHQPKKGSTAALPAADSSAPVNNSDKGVVNEMVDILMGALGDQTMRSKQFFKDSLRGKAIVVENVKAQLDASKASKRIELAGKRKQSISNRALKRLKVACPSSLPSDAEIVMLHDLWWEYALQLMGNCHSEAQLQARLYSMEYVGARVYVLDCTDASLVGTVGIITAVSKNCFFLAVDVDAKEGVVSEGKGQSNSSSGVKSATTDSKTSPSNTVTAHTTTTTTTTTTPTALTLVKTTTTIGIVLPSLHSKHKPHTTSIHATHTNHTTHTPHALFSDDPEVTANTAANSGSSIDTSSETNNNDIHNIPTTSTTSSGGYKYNHNEREGGGRICVLYGKHFMPHCKYD